MLTRLKHLKAEQLILVVAVFSLVFFLLWSVVIAGIWTILHQSFGGEFWGALEGTSSAAAFAITLGGGLVILFQLNAALESRDLDVYNNAFERMMDDDNIDARRWIYLNLPDDVEEGLALLAQDPEGQAHVKRVLNSFDHLGFLVEQEWVMSEAVIKWVSPFVVKIWAKLKPYIDYEIERRNEPDYYEAAQHLAERCAEWRIKNVPDAKITWVKDAL